MSFGTAGFSKPKRSPSGKWVDLQPRERKPKAMNRVGKKSEWWMFINAVLEMFFVVIGQPRVCEIQSFACDNYHIAKAHTRRRTIIPITDYWHAFRVCFSCGECHDWADQRERDDSENIIETVINDRFQRLGLSEAEVKRILIECAVKVQRENPEKFGQYEVTL